jgi:ABC-type sugar transport system ATPase subunit
MSIAQAESRVPAEHADGDVLCGLRNIFKRFGVVQALKDVSIDIRPGEVLAVVGENGAGKSTLMRILEGEHQPDSGEISFDGRPVHLADIRAARRLGIRVIHQEPEILPDLSVAENIFIGELKSQAGCSSTAPMRSGARAACSRPLAWSGSWLPGNGAAASGRGSGR